MRGGVVLEARGELREQSAELARLLEGRDGLAEAVDVAAVDLGVAAAACGGGDIFGWVNCWYSLTEKVKSSGVRSAQAAVTERRGTP